MSQVNANLGYKAEYTGRKWMQSLIMMMTIL